MLAFRSKIVYVSYSVLKICLITAVEIFEILLVFTVNNGSKDFREIKILELLTSQFLNFYIISNLTDLSHFYFVVTDVIVK